MKHFKLKKRCKICHEVVEPGYKYMEIPDRDEYICEECINDMKSAEFLEQIEAKEYSVGDLMEFFEIEFMEETDGQYDCI